MFSKFYKNVKREKVDVVECVIVCSNVYHFMCASILKGEDCVKLKNLMNKRKEKSLFK